MKKPESRVTAARACVVASLALVGAVDGQSADPCGLKGAAAGAIYDRPVTVELESPLNQAGAGIRINGEPYVPGRRLDKDGHYFVEVRRGGPLVLGSELCEPVTFTIDTTPPVIEFVRPEGLPKGAVPRVRVTDENLPADGGRIQLARQVPEARQ